MTRAARAAPLDIVFSAETPEGIALALRPAGMMARSYAYLIDATIRVALISVAIGVLTALGRFGIGIFLILSFALEWLYPVLFELLPAAATPGKRALGLRVVLDSGLPVTPAAALLRNLLRAADFLPIGYAFGLLLMLLRPDFKRLGDLAAGTLVVHVAETVLHGRLADAEPVAPARALDAGEQAAVLAWAGRATRLTPERLGELALLARPATGPWPGPGAGGASEAVWATQRLQGVAQWLLGHR